MADMPEPVDWRRRAARRALWPMLLAVAGFVVVLIGKDDTLGIVGWGIVGLGVTIAISLVFLEVGYSEDRERAASAGLEADDRRPAGAVDPDPRDGASGG